MSLTGASMFILDADVQHIDALIWYKSEHRFMKKNARSAHHLYRLEVSPDLTYFSLIFRSKVLEAPSLLH